MRLSPAILLMIVLSLLSQSATAQLRLPNVLSDHAVLQRNHPIHIWGWAAPAEAVTVRFHEQSVAALADSFGLWDIWLHPEVAGGPYTLKISGSITPKPLERTDLLVGDVWLASGQSNMQFPLKGFSKAPLKNGAQEIAAANHPQIRLLLQKPRASALPLADQDNTWAVCSPTSTADFSAVAYFFGREILEHEHVPVGLIDTTWGGTPAQAWISADGIAYANLTSVYLDGADVIRNQGRADMIRDQLALLGDASGKQIPHRIPNQHFGSWNPSALFNGMISPYANYTIKGVIWYQGESDHTSNRAANYARVFTSLIADWRKQWAEGSFPFLYVQISSYNDKEEFGMVRDAQRRALDMQNTGMAVTLDVGQPDNIHPPDKQTVGSRLAQIARGMVYDESFEYNSPIFLEATSEGDSMRVWFAHADGLHPGPINSGDFEVAGEDHKFVPAEVKLENIAGQITVLATAPSVKNPRYVRYGWSPVVTHFLYNASGLPAGTFTSEP